MSDKSKKIKMPSIKHPCADLVSTWTLRILIDLEGWKYMSGLFSSYTGDGDILRAIGLGHLEDKEMGKEEFLTLLTMYSTPSSASKSKSSIKIEIQRLLLFTIREPKSA